LKMRSRGGDTRPFQMRKAGDRPPCVRWQATRGRVRHIPTLPIRRSAPPAWRDNRARQHILTRWDDEAGDGGEPTPSRSRERNGAADLIGGQVFWGAQIFLGGPSRLQPQGPQPTWVAPLLGASHIPAPPRRLVGPNSTGRVAATPSCRTAA